jgi:YVTN family beta-propeller protein
LRRATRSGDIADGRWGSEALQSVVIVDISAGKILSAIPTRLYVQRLVGRHDNRTAFVTFGADNSVGVIDLSERTLKTRFPVGASPNGVAYGRAPVKF